MKYSAPLAPPPRIVVVMGVSGTGKTTVGQRLARHLGWTFADADDFHPAANVAKMRAGTALNDADRAPWLAALAERMRAALTAQETLVLACSALKASYRAILDVDPATRAVAFVHLTGARELLASRLQARPGHFMPASLLASQLATLEPPADALTLDVISPPEKLVEAICAQWQLSR